MSNDSVLESLKELSEKKYRVTDRPENETAVPVKEDSYHVTYKLIGTLGIQSSLTYFNFGRRTVTVDSSNIKIEKATYDEPLIIWDNREVSQPWILTATLKEPLKHVENETVLPQALRYKVSEEETVVLSEDMAQAIATRTNTEKGEY